MPVVRQSVAPNRTLPDEAGIMTELASILRSALEFFLCGILIVAEFATLEFLIDD